MKINNLEKEELIELLEDLNPVEDSSGTNLIIDCPACGQRECKISINKSGHLWGCFRLKKCGESGNIWKILKLLGKLNFLFNKKSNSDFIDIPSLFNKDDESQTINFDIEELPDSPKPFGWERVINGDKYLDSRGFKSYERCEVGRTSIDPELKNDYVIFLVRENGKIKAYVGRHVWSKDKIEEYNEKYFEKTGIKNKIKRYKNSDGTQFGKLLYGYDELDENNVVPVCLVEGIFDKHAVDEKLNLHNNKLMKCCATFKAAVSDDQIVKLLLKGVTDIILFYDPDVINIIKKNVIKLSNFFNVKVIISSINKDPDELTTDEIIYVFENNMYDANSIMDDFIQVPGLF